MNLFLRLLWALLRATLSRRTLPIDGAAIYPARVRITDTDSRKAMTMSRHSSLLDIAIMDFFVRTGIMRKLRKSGWIPLIVGKSIDIHAPLKRGQRYDIQTRIAGWRDGYTFFEHKFRSGDRLHATAVSIGRLLASGERLSQDDILLMFGLAGRPSPALSPIMLRLHDQLAAAKPLSGADTQADG